MYCYKARSIHKAPSMHVADQAPSIHKAHSMHVAEHRDNDHKQAFPTRTSLGIGLSYEMLCCGVKNTI